MASERRNLEIHLSYSDVEGKKIAAGQIELFLQTLIAGLLLGGLYALIGLGMALILGVMKIINLAHGDLMMVAMYIAYVLFQYFHIDPYIAVFIAAPMLFILGAGLQKFLISPML